MGAPKTGTTYLQDRLALNADSLRRHGYAYPTGPHDDMFLAALDVVDRPWPEIWEDVHRSLDEVCAFELRIAEALLAEDGTEDLGARLHHAELVSPTRPHPWIPHQGVRGHLARVVARRVDRFWDAAEGRMVPEPVRHHDRTHQGKLTQYLLADPHLPDEE